MGRGIRIAVGTPTACAVPVSGGLALWSSMARPGVCQTNLAMAQGAVEGAHS